MRTLLAQLQHADLAQVRSYSKQNLAACQHSTRHDSSFLKMPVLSSVLLGTLTILPYHGQTHFT